MSYTMKPFEDLDIIDDFLMNAAACDEEVGLEFSRTLIHGLLQRDLGKIQIGIQKVIFPNTPNLRGIRLDIEVDEYETIDGELQISNIFDIEPNKRQEVNDGLTFIYFNTVGSKGGNSSIKSLLNFIQKSKIENVTDEVTQKLHDCISKVKVSPELRMEYMKWDAMIYYERRDAKNEGKIEGKIESILELLEELGLLPAETKEKISVETNLEQIKKWHKLAAKVNSIEEFIEKM